MGVVCLNKESVAKDLRFIQNGIGSVPSPFDCYLVMRGLKTLHLRMEAHCHNAHRIALLLESHSPDVVERVLYPGLPSHPQHSLACEQMTPGKGGGMITFFIQGGLESARTFLESLKVFALAESLGGVESLAEHPFCRHISRVCVCSLCVCVCIVQHVSARFILQCLVSC